MNSSLITAIVVGIPAAIGVLAAYKRGRRADDIAEQAGIATVESGTIGQVIDGLNKHNANLQTDNAVLRSDNLVHRKRGDDCERQLAIIASFPSAERTTP